MILGLTIISVLAYLIISQLNSEYATTRGIILSSPAPRPPIPIYNRKIYDDDVRTIPNAIRAADGLPLIFISTIEHQGSLRILKCQDPLCETISSSSQNAVWPDSFFSAV